MVSPTVPFELTCQYQRKEGKQEGVSLFRRMSWTRLESIRFQAGPGENKKKDQNIGNIESLSEPRHASGKSIRLHEVEASNVT